MKVSVVICTYSEDMYEHFEDSLESIRAQTYDDIEIIVIVDGNDALYDRIEADYGDDSELKIHCNDENLGLSGSRNNALQFVTGDVVALIDDDAVADERWVEELVSVYENCDAIAAGGQMTPIWVAGKPEFLPEEFYWLVGVTHRGFAEAGEEVRNTFGSNISFRTEVLEELGGFATEVGRQGEKNLQAEETLLGAQIRENYGRGVVYNPEAKVGHKVFEWRTDFWWLVDRAFWQGYSKWEMKSMVANEGDEEFDFLMHIFMKSTARRAKHIVKNRTCSEIAQFIAVYLFSVVVGIGYFYAALVHLTQH